jgi:hypothetical protein
VPVVLTQTAYRDDPRYKDTEFVVYHFPKRVYARLVKSGEEFVYYRPLRGSAKAEASSYFGCGLLGDVWDDPSDDMHAFVAIKKPVPFAVPVPYRDSNGQMYESSFGVPQAFTGRSIREIGLLDYYRILAAAGLTTSLLEMSPTVDDVLMGSVSRLIHPPKDALRPLRVVPPGTGYVPSGRDAPDVFESAALQERARADHQETVALLKRDVDARGGVCEFNNNIDVLATFGSARFLIEVKSLVSPSAAVDRMRYGMGQLFDYGVRYRAEIGDAAPILVFGTAPRRDVAWIAEVLEGNHVACVTRDEGRLVPLNPSAREFPIFR